MAAGGQAGTVDGWTALVVAVPAGGGVLLPHDEDAPLTVGKIVRRAKNAARKR